MRRVIDFEVPVDRRTDRAWPADIYDQMGIGPQYGAALAGKIQPIILIEIYPKEDRPRIQRLPVLELVDEEARTSRVGIAWLRTGGRAEEGRDYEGRKNWSTHAHLLI